MSVSVTLNGTSYTIPQTSESGWGVALTSWIQAVSSSTLQKSGGTFTLTSEAYFGANFGIKSLYFKSATANPSVVGIIRLANNDAVVWRNGANSADLGLKVDSSDNLVFHGIPIIPSVGFTINRAIVSDGSGGLAAATTTSTEIGYVNGVTSGIQTQLGTNISSGTAAIVNADVSASAAIAFSKLAALSSANILVGSAGNVATSTAVTGDVTITNAGVTAIGATKVTNAMLAGSIDLTTKVTGALPATNGGTGTATVTTGDIIYGSATNTWSKLALGTAGKSLKMGGSSIPNWIYASTSGTAKTSNYAVADVDDVVLFDTSGGNLTCTLPTLISGKTITIYKGTADFNTVQILTTGGVTVDGFASGSYYLSTNRESITVFGGSTNWQVIDHKYYSGWTSFTPTWTSSGTAVALGNGTLSGMYQRIGDSARIRISLVSGTSTTYGTGTFFFNYAALGTADTSRYVNGSNSAVVSNLGTAYSAISGANFFCGLCVNPTTSTTGVIVRDSSGASSWNATVPASWAASTANQIVSVDFLVPMTNWMP